jgi:SRSO17 transposase
VRLSLKRKSLPEIAKIIGLESPEKLNHFLTKSIWSREEIEQRRLELILKIINGEEIIVIIDETGDKKKELPQIMSRDNISEISEK